MKRSISNTKASLNNNIFGTESQFSVVIHVAFPYTINQINRWRYPAPFLSPQPQGQADSSQANRVQLFSSEDPFCERSAVCACGGLGGGLEKWLSLHSFLLFALRCVFARNVCENEFISFYRSCPCCASDIKESHRLFPMLFFLVLDGCFTLCEHFFNIIFNIFNVGFFIITSNGIILWQSADASIVIAIINFDMSNLLPLLLLPYFCYYRIIYDNWGLKQYLHHH